MIKDLNKGTIKVKFSNILSWANFYWVIGILCLSVPYNISWSLGNGNFGYDIRNTIILSIIGVFLFTFSSKKDSAEGGNFPPIIDRNYWAPVNSFSEFDWSRILWPECYSVHVRFGVGCRAAVVKINTRSSYLYF